MSERAKGILREGRTERGQENMNDNPGGPAVVMVTVVASTLYFGRGKKYQPIFGSFL